MIWVVAGIVRRAQRCSSVIAPADSLAMSLRLASSERGGRRARVVDIMDIVEHGMSGNDMHDTSSTSSAPPPQECSKTSAVDYRCFRPSPLPAQPLSGAESDHFNAALQFKRPVTCTTDPPTLPTPAELECLGKKFKLDAFQLIAAGCILKGESVLVCAHTSSGKTVVGEFAVARALAAGQRILYAPIVFPRRKTVTRCAGTPPL